MKSDIFKKEKVKDILRCFEKVNNPRLRFSDIKKGLPNKKYFDKQIVRTLNDMISFGILNKIKYSKRRADYHLTNKYMVEVRQSQLSRLIDSYSPEDVMDYSKTVLLGLPHEVYHPHKNEVPSGYFQDLNIEPQDLFSDDSLFVQKLKEQMKEMVIKSIDEDYKNKTKDEVLEALKKNILSQTNRDLSFKRSIPPYEACERIVRKLVEGRDKYRLLLIQQEYDSQLPHLIDSGFRQYMFDHQEYYTQKLNLSFMHFFKLGRHTQKDRYKDFESKEDFDDTLLLFFNVDDDQLQKEIVRPLSESVLRWGIEILKFLSTIVQNVNEQTNDRYITPITIVSTSFRAVIATNEFWENDAKIRKIIKQQK